MGDGSGDPTLGGYGFNRAFFFTLLGIVLFLLVMFVITSVGNSGAFGVVDVDADDDEDEEDEEFGGRRQRMYYKKLNLPRLFVRPPTLASIKRSFAAAPSSSLSSPAWNRNKNPRTTTTTNDSSNIQMQQQFNDAIMTPRSSLSSNHYNHHYNHHQPSQFSSRPAATTKIPFHGCNEPHQQQGQFEPSTTTDYHGFCYRPEEEEEDGQYSSFSGSQGHQYQQHPQQQQQQQHSHYHYYSHPTIENRMKIS